MKRDIFALRAWLPAVLWTALIVLESMFGASSNTGPLLEKAAFWLFGAIDPEYFAVLHFLLRKAGHVLGYGLLGYLWFRAFLLTFAGSTLLTCAALAIVCTLLIAVLDEWHQSFSPGRTGHAQDVILNTLGALMFVSLAMVSAVRRRRAAAGEQAAL